MSLTRKVAINTIIQSIGRIFSVAIGLATIAFITRYLGRLGFGQYSIVIAWTGFFSILADLGLYLVVTNEVSKKDAPVSSIMSNAFTLRILTSLLIMGLAPIIALIMPYPAIVKQGILIGAISFFFLSLRYVLGGLFQKFLHTEKIALAEVLGKGVSLGLVVLAIFLKLHLLYILGAAALGSLAQFLTAFLFAQKYVRIRLRFDFSIWQDLAKKAWPLAISVIFTLIYFKFDTILLSIMKPAEDVGIYGAAYKILEVLIAFSAIFCGLVLPLLSRFKDSDPERFKSIFQRSFDTLVTLACPLVIGVLFLARPIMTFIGGAEFTISGIPLQILIFAVAIIFVGNLFGHTIVALDKQKKMMWVYITGAFLSIVTNLIFIPPFSYIGASVTTVFVEIVVVIWGGIIIYKTIRFLPNLKILVKSILCSLAMIPILTIFSQVNFIVLIISSSILYFGMLYLVGGIKKEVLKELFIKGKLSN